MPSRGPSPLEVPFCRDLAALDALEDTGLLAHDGVLPYIQRAPSKSHPSRLLVCHDFKGGYTEECNSEGYTFNFWSWCDIFVYFSHHRVTIPPPGWITAAHRQGSKILGTLIFENEDGALDGLRLLFGPPPSAITGPALPSSTVSSDVVPVNDHYAILLAKLAALRGFDGWLLNFESDLQAGAGVGEARSLTTWMTLLTSEMKRQVGDHAEVIWYDSVIYTGEVRWQNRLNARNLPFFGPSTGFFTNYNWHQSYPALQAAYISKIASETPPSSYTPRKTAQDIYAGVDVWGRGSHGGGGFGAYRALEHVTPSGLSTALFGQGWSWESIESERGFSWERWWEYDRMLWLGPTSELQKSRMVLPPASTTKRKDDDPECPHGPYHPLTDFFERKSPPAIDARPFYTTFSTGTGRGWWVRGTRMSSAAWTDVQKQCSLGDLVWPTPALTWESGEAHEDLPSAVPELDFEDAWVGGGSLRIKINVPERSLDGTRRSRVWMPVQSLVVAAGGVYEAVLVFKKRDALPVDVDVRLSVYPNGFPSDQLQVQLPAKQSNLSRDWKQQSLSFLVPTTPACDVTVMVGIIVDLAGCAAAQDFSATLTLGQLSVVPTSPAPLSTCANRLLWAKYTPSSNTDFFGVISWAAALYPPQTTPPDVIPPADSTDHLWHATQVRPADKLAYVNIYAQTRERAPSGPATAAFICTSGAEGWRCKARISREGVREAGLEKEKEVRFYVQGVSDSGEVLDWEQCVFVDASLE